MAIRYVHAKNGSSTGAFDSTSHPVRKISDRGDVGHIITKARWNFKKLTAMAASQQIRPE